MKKIIFLGLALLGLAVIANAALTTAGSINTPLVDQDANGKLVLRFFQVNPSGTPLPTPSSGSGSAVVVTNTTPIPVLQASPTPGILPVSPTTATLNFSTGTFTWTTHTTQSQAITVRSNITLRAVRGGTSLIYNITANPTPGAEIAALEGREVVTGASHKTEGPCYQPTQYVHMRASGTASVVGTLIIDECK